MGKEIKGRKVTEKWEKKTSPSQKLVTALCAVDRSSTLHCDTPDCS